MNADQWVWMPHAAHFIGSRSCQFHLATYVGHYIVSTVGELFWGMEINRIHAKFHDPKWLTENGHLRGDDFQAAFFRRFGWQELGINRTYETMVFVAIPGESGYECCPWRIDPSEELDFRGYNDAADAVRGHMELCKQWSDTPAPGGSGNG